MKPKFTYTERTWFRRYRQQMASQEQHHPEQTNLNAGLRYVVKMAFRLRGLGLQLPDLVSAGNEGLARALQNYDPCCGSPFLSYAHIYIYGAMCNELRRHPPLETFDPTEPDDEEDEDD